MTGPEKAALDPAALRNAVTDQPASTAGAWAYGAASVEGFLRRVVADLDRMPALRVHHAEFGNYGSGYASYVDVFVTRRDGSACRSANGWTEVEGLPLALAGSRRWRCSSRPAVNPRGRTAPVAAACRSCRWSRTMLRRDGRRNTGRSVRCSIGTTSACSMLGYSACR